MCIARVRRRVFVPEPSNLTAAQNEEQHQANNNMSFEQRRDQPLPEPSIEEPPSNGATNGERATESADIYDAPLPPAPVDESSRVVDDVLYSDVCLPYIDNYRERANATSDWCQYTAQ